MAEILKGEFSEKNPKMSGSMFINNTSYSGVDIKVVINIYNPGKTYQNEIDQLEKSIKRAEQEIKSYREKAYGLNNRISRGKTATAQWYLLSNKLNRIEDIIQERQIFIKETQDRLTELKNKIPTTSTKVLAECQTLSLSVFRDKQSVRSCGTVYPRGFTRGPREIGGSLVFSVFNEHVLYQFLEAHASDFDAVSFTTAVLDQLPPVDITVSFANEYGSVSRMSILGVEFVSEGQVMSIEDLLTENVVNFIARDWDPMRSVKERKLDENSIMVSQFQPKRASDLLLEEDFQKYNSQSPFERFKRRRNPFL